MREILFRGKRIDNGEWVEGCGIIATENWVSIFTVIDDIDENSSEVNEIEVLPETVGQYVGKTDKNGKKIFEGDIIRYADLYDYNCYLECIDNSEAYDDIDLGNIWTIDEVVYGIKVGYPAFDLNKSDFEINGLSELSESGQYFYEVIGNIHDNPELIQRSDNNAE